MRIGLRVLHRALVVRAGAYDWLYAERRSEVAKLDVRLIDPFDLLSVAERVAEGHVAVRPDLADSIETGLRHTHELHSAYLAAFASDDQDSMREIADRLRLELLLLERLPSIIDRAGWLRLRQLNRSLDGYRGRAASDLRREITRALSARSSCRRVPGRTTRRRGNRTRRAATARRGPPSGSDAESDLARPRRAQRSLA
jgi:hypothetical protein